MCVFRKMIKCMAITLLICIGYVSIASAFPKMENFESALPLNYEYGVQETVERYNEYMDIPVLRVYRASRFMWDDKESMYIATSPYDENFYLMFLCGPDGYIKMASAVIPNTFSDSNSEKVLETLVLAGIGTQVDIKQVDDKLLNAVKAVKYASNELHKTTFYKNADKIYRLAYLKNYPSKNISVWGVVRTLK